MVLSTQLTFHCRMRFAYMTPPLLSLLSCVARASPAHTGQQQAASTAEVLAALHTKGDLANISRIISSPLSRAIQTAQHAAQALGKLQVEVSALHTERVCVSCDRGSPASTLISKFPAIDFSALEEIWWPATEETTLWDGAAPSHVPTEVQQVQRYNASLALIQERARQFNAWVMEQPEDELVVVGHGAFFLAVLGARMQNCEFAATNWPPMHYPARCFTCVVPDVKTVQW
jgi:broad specificity phosphatase PhoE